MRIARYLSLALAAATTAHAARHPSKYSFKPENDETYWDDRIPILYDLSESQSASFSGSWWSSSFLTGTNNKQYFLISHTLSTPAFSYHRASKLDLETLEHDHFITRTTGSTGDDGKILSLDVNGNGFRALTADNVSTLRTYSTNKDLGFDITWNATSKVLVNVGSGGFAFGPVVTYEWAIPSGRTVGTITGKDGKAITINPDKSFTWYDRQWGTGVVSSGNWTWFELHVPETNYKLSVWAIDDEGTNTKTRFATIRGENGETQVLPVEWTPGYKRSFKSHAADITYPLDWTVKISGFGDLKVSSIVEDQELVGELALETAYAGFVTFSGTILNKKAKGYGVVEALFGSWD